MAVGWDSVADARPDATVLGPPTRSPTVSLPMSKKWSILSKKSTLAEGAPMGNAPLAVLGDLLRKYTKSEVLTQLANSREVQPEAADSVEWRNACESRQATLQASTSATLRRAWRSVPAQIGGRSRCRAVQGDGPVFASHSASPFVRRHALRSPVVRS